jgi:hypothetical protein
MLKSWLCGTGAPSSLCHRRLLLSLSEVKRFRNPGPLIITRGNVSICEGIVLDRAYLSNFCMVIERQVLSERTAIWSHESASHLCIEALLRDHGICSNYE